MASAWTRAAEFIGSQTRFPALTIGSPDGLHGGCQMSWTRSGTRVGPAQVHDAIIMTKQIAILFSILLSTCSLLDAEQPNIILIMVDDLGYADISPYGQSKIQTPNLAKMAEQGMTFTQFYSGVSVCAPSRSSLMEGLHTGHCYIRGNKQNGTVGGQWPIPEDTVTMASGAYSKRATRPA